jgi:hypothetical protein
MKHLAHSSSHSLHALFVVAAAIALAACAPPPSPPTNGSAPANVETPSRTTMRIERPSAKPPAILAATPPVSSKAISCPSQDFKEFLKAFANRRDVREAYTAQPSKHKYPYYWKHNTQPGDPRYPKWVTDEGYGATDPRYRYNEESGEYGYLPSASSSDEQLAVWSIRDSDGRLRGFFPYSKYGYRFDTKRVSATEYQVVFDDGSIETFVKRPGCWYLDEFWEKAEEELVNCRSREECQQMLEYEGDG